MAASKPAPKKAAKSNKPVAKKATAPQKQLGKKPTAKTQKPVAKAKPAVSSKKVLPPARKQPAKPTAKVQTKKAPIATPKSAAKSAIAKKKEIKPIAKVAPKSLKKLPATKPKTVVKVAVITKNKQIKPVVKVAPKPIKKAPIAAPKPVAKAIAHSQPELQTKQKITAVPQKPAVQLKQATPPIMPVKKKEEIKPSKIVVPKTTVKTMVKYEPDFTKSVLDTNGHSYEPTLPTMRYSDHDLAEFRDLINRKLEVAKKELTYLQGLITHKDEMGGDNDDARYMTMEDGSLSMEREQLSQMASRQITFVDHLEKALMRIESKTYGVCRVTGKLIDKARLRAVPHATLSVEAKMGKVK